MKTDITPDQITHYREPGYLVIDDFLSSHELAEWRRCVDAAVAAREDRKASGPPSFSFWLN